MRMVVRGLDCPSTATKWAVTREGKPALSNTPCGAVPPVHTKHSSPRCAHRQYYRESSPPALMASCIIWRHPPLSCDARAGTREQYLAQHRVQRVQDGGHVDGGSQDSCIEESLHYASQNSRTRYLDNAGHESPAVERPHVSGHRDEPDRGTGGMQ